ncbi:MAG: acetyl-CoA carboxylase biotin carboxyl carrier protein subunit [Selenomonadales bacterium]|jgi:glutaconyl-coA decarboxylase subunit gamma|nr:biotin/lipoyl-binding protein [Clostridiales bacterium]PWL98622.1 MAG: acetyl-CoA carboxylase biotin carboxyl carrier protein subunit [Selenomonadales bacterium]
MRKFIVQVNGVQYDVEIEEIGGACAPAAMPAAQSASAPAPAAQSAPAAPAPSAPAPAAPAQSAPAAAQSVGGEAIKAPLPGTVLDIKVAPGQNVTKGDVLFVLEAMKMENEILAAHDGVIASVNVQKSSSVNSGDVLGSYK